MRRGRQTLRDTELLLFQAAALRIKHSLKVQLLSLLIDIYCDRQHELCYSGLQPVLCFFFLSLSFLFLLMVNASYEFKYKNDLEL